MRNLDNKQTAPKQMHPDVPDICMLLQCMGFKIKSVTCDESSRNLNNVGQALSITCKISGMSMIMESSTTECNCPVDSERESSGFWQVSGVSGGIIESNKETGSTLLESLPKETSFYVTNELAKLIELTRSKCYVDKLDNNKNVTTDIIPPVNQLDIKEDRSLSDASVSLGNLNESPPRSKYLMHLLKTETPTRYRSLDTLTNVKNLDDDIPKPGPLIPKHNTSSDSENINVDKHDEDVSKPVVARQQTYNFTTPTQEKIKKYRRSKTLTSSPIAKVPPILWQDLVTAEKMAKDLHSKLQSILKNPVAVEDEKIDASVASLDVSKISLQKDQPHDITKPITKLRHPISQFASSPNLSGCRMSSLTDANRPNLTRVNSSSTSKLVQIHVTSRPVKLKKASTDMGISLSPTTFTKRKESAANSIPGNSMVIGSYKPLTEKGQYITTGIAKPKMLKFTE